MSRSPHRAPQGPSQRQLRVGELIRRTLSEVLAQGDLHDPDLEGTSITVGEVRASPDLKQATAYVLPLGGARRDETLAALVAEATSPDRIRADSIAASVPSAEVSLDGQHDAAPTP